MSIGDLLIDGRATLQGKQAVGKNLFIAYIPWDGLNFEDAMMVSTKLVVRELFTSIRIECYETSLHTTSRGKESFVPFSLILIFRVQGRQKKTCDKFFLFKKTNSFFSVDKNVQEGVDFARPVQLKKIFDCRYLRKFTYKYEIFFRKKKNEMFE